MIKRIVIASAILFAAPAFAVDRFGSIPIPDHVTVRGHDNHDGGPGSSGFKIDHDVTAKLEVYPGDTDGCGGDPFRKSAIHWTVSAESSDDGLVLVVRSGTTVATIPRELLESLFCERVSLDPQPQPDFILLEPLKP